MESPANILIVDDRAENLLALNALLTAPDHNLINARSGVEALGQLLKHDFAVLLLDVQMPEMDGFELARLIHGRPNTRKIPIIFVTAADAERRYAYQGYEAGAVDYLTKPIDPLILKSKVAVFVELYRKNLEILRHAEQLRENERVNHEQRFMALELLALRRYRTLANAIPHMVWKSDANGHLLYCNKVWEDYTGAIDGAVWRPWPDLVHTDDLKAFEEAWTQARQAPARPFEAVVRLKRASDGSYRWHLVRGTPDIEEVPAWLGTCTDIHDRKQAEEKLGEKARELARSNSDLEQFAYIASHDLQEPLRMVASYAQLLERRFKGELGPTGDKYIHYMVDGATRMQALINDLLTYSRAGKGERNFVPTDFNLSVEHVLRDLRDAIRESGAVVTHDKLPTIGALPQKIDQLLLNLIGNAIKFRSQPPPRVHVSAVERDDGWIFSVRDNGIGIDARYFERIFVIFQRLHTRAQYPGTGIGLAICKKIVESHQGRIWVESEPGKGSVFSFSIPRNLASPGELPEREMRYA